MMGFGSTGLLGGIIGLVIHLAILIGIVVLIVWAVKRFTTGNRRARSCKRVTHDVRLLVINISRC